MKHIINNQRVIETETDLLIKRYRKKIGELKAETASYAPETFNVMIKELLDRINAMMTFANDEVRALVLELVMEIESVGQEAAVKAYQKSLNISLTESHTVTRKKTVKKSRNEATRLAAAGYSNMQVIDAIFGFKTNQYEDGIAGASQNQVAANSRTLAKQTVELEKENKRKDNREIIGYVWVSVLDNRTSTICQDLSGKEFYYDKSGIKMLPPAHINCRSSTESIYKNKPVPIFDTFPEWAKKQENQEDLREAMGKTRYDLFKNGKLKIERFNNAFFEPLNLEKMKRQNKNAFDKLK